MDEVTKPRARDLGIPFDGISGSLKAITDVKGVEVGHNTSSWSHGSSGSLASKNNDVTDGLNSAATGDIRLTDSIGK